MLLQPTNGGHSTWGLPDEIREMIKASEFRFLQDGTKREYSCKIEGGQFPEQLYFKGDASALPERTPPSGNFALVGLLYPAMVLGEDLEIEAAVSPILLYAIQHDIQSLLIDYRPELKRIKVSATSTLSASHSAQTNVATGFSAGVDTFTTLALFTAEDVPDSLRLTSLTLFDVGAMGPPNLTSEIFEKYRCRVRDYSENNSFNWQAVRSNLDQFYGVIGHGFQLNHVIRNVAAALVFEDILSCYLYSSSYPYRHINTGNDDMSFIEPMLLSLLSTETVQFKSAGAGLAREQKTELVSSYQPAMLMLDVCVASAAIRLKSKKINCSNCWKCSRTMLNLDVLGRLNDFAEVFDIAYYRLNKDRMILTIFDSAKKGKLVERDLITLMQEKNFDLSISKFRLLKWRLSSFATNSIRQILSRAPGLRTLYRTIRR